jgi:hypothetical protein
MGSTLYGKVISDRSEASRQSQHAVEAYVQTQYGRLTVYLSADGSYQVTRERVRDYAPCGGMQTLASGNINSDSAPGAEDQEDREEHAHAA